MSKAGVGLSPARRRRSIVLGALGCCTLLSRAVVADEPAEFLWRDWSVSGFGTLAAVHSSDRDADFVSLIAQPTGPGFSHAWDAATDSKLGVQLTAPLVKQLSAVVQVVSQYQYDGTMVPQIEWANLSYRFTVSDSDVLVRVGRIAMPARMISDSRMVGYSNPWIRPPVEVYQDEPLTHNDGVDLSWVSHHGALTSTTQVLYGNANIGLPNQLTVEAHHTWGLNETVDYRSLSVQVHFANTRITFESPSIGMLFQGYGALGDALATIPGEQSQAATIDSLITRFDPHRMPLSQLDLGLNYDPGKWFLMGEVSGEPESGLLAKTFAWYVTPGVRLRKFTPYVTVAAVRNSYRPFAFPDLAALPAPLVATATMLQAGAERALAVATQHSVSIGLRWDVCKNTDVKLQLDRIQLGSGSSGVLVNAQPAFHPGSALSVVGLAVDVVF